MWLPLVLACAPTPQAEPWSPTSEPATTQPAGWVDEQRSAWRATSADVLLVVDSTSSMSEEQLTLLEAIPLPDPADAQPAAAWRYGVLDPNAEAGWGKLVSVGGWRYVSPVTPDPEAVLTAMVQRSSGATGARSLDVVLAALSPALLSGYNQNFLRDGADLHLLFVQNEDDVSDIDVDAFLRELELAVPTHRSVTAWGLVGLDGACPTALDAPRIADVVARTGGATESLCAPSYSPFLDGVAPQWLAGTEPIYLSQLPDPSTLRVYVDDGAARYDGIPAGLTPADAAAACDAASCFRFTYDPTENALRVGSFVPSPDAEVHITYQTLAGALADAE